METETGNVQENRYDAEGLRFELLENGRRTSFVYHDGELLQEEGREEQGTSYHLGAGMEAFRRGQELSYYHRDEQLSTALVTDGHRNVQNSYQYDAFGMSLGTTEKLNNRIRYTGQQYDDVTGQYYLRARYYNPVAGRFMQEDVYQGDGLNLYAYCGNNPVVYDDPSGYERKACPPQGKISESIDESGSYSGTGEYGDVGGHHVHAKAGFKDDVNYDPKKGFSISQNFMRDNGLDHNIMTSKQRELFKELYESGRPNTLEEHTRIAREALKAGGASDSMIDDLINASLRNLREQGVTAPTRIPWYSK